MSTLKRTFFALVVLLSLLSLTAYAHSPGRYRCKGSFWAMACPVLDAQGERVGKSLPQGFNLELSQFKTVTKVNWWGGEYSVTLGYSPKGSYAGWYDMSRMEPK